MSEKKENKKESNNEWGNILINYTNTKDKLVPFNLIFDRLDSIKARIAYSIDSLPRLTIYNRLPESKRYQYQYNIESFKLEVENSEYFVKNAPMLMKKYNIKTKKEYTLYWIYFNKDFRRKEGKLYTTIEKLEASRNGAFQIYTNIKGFYDNESENLSEFVNIYKDVEEFAKKLDTEFLQLKIKIEDDNINFKKLINTEMSNNTDLEITQTIQK